MAFLPDPLEIQSWAVRGGAPHAGRFNFTRGEELARRSGPDQFPFRFDAESGWLPPALQATILQALPAFLDPFGSPNGSGTLPATWGLGPWDLYHCHLRLWTGGALPVPQQLAGRGAILQGLHQVLLGLAAASGVPVDLAYAREVRRLLVQGFTAPSGFPIKLLEQYGALASDAVLAATQAQPLLFI